MSILVTYNEFGIRKIQQMIIQIETHVNGISNKNIFTILQTITYTYCCLVST